MIVRGIVFSGKVVPKKVVVEVIQRFNIQVNNLTQVSYWTIYLHDDDYIRCDIFILFYLVGL